MASPVVTVAAVRKTRGLTTYVEISGVDAEFVSSEAATSAILALPPPARAARASKLPPLGWTTAAAAHESYYMLGLTRVKGVFDDKSRSVSAQDCTSMELEFMSPVITQLSFYRCSNCTITITCPVGSLRVDDCTGLDFRLTWDAAVGYPDDSGQSLGGCGLSVLHSASHRIRIFRPIGPEEGAPSAPASLPEVVSTVFANPTAKGVSKAVDLTASPWGQG